MKFIKELPFFLKATAAVLTAAGGALTTALADGILSQAEILGVAVTTLAAIGAAASQKPQVPADV